MKKFFKVCSGALALSLLLVSISTTKVEAKSSVESNLYVTPVITKETIIKNVQDAGGELHYVEPEDFNLLMETSDYPIFTEHKSSNGSRVFEFYEDNNYNVVEYKISGDVYLNNSPITVTTLDDQGNVIDIRILNIYDTEPMAQRTRKFETLPSGLTDADLPTHLGTENKVVSLGNTFWKEIGIGTVTAILLNPFVGLWGVVAGVVAGGLISVAKQLTPYSNHLSFKRSQRRGLHVGGYLMIVKTYVSYYGNPNFTARLGSSTHYTGYFN